MIIQDKGHVYAVTEYDHSDENNGLQRIVFMKREGVGYPGNKGSHPGTNCQELIRVLIDRVKYLDNQISSNYNRLILADLQDSLLKFEQRAAERHGLSLATLSYKDIEKLPTCHVCGHIKCKHKPE